MAAICAVLVLAGSSPRQASVPIPVAPHPAPLTVPVTAQAVPLRIAQLVPVDVIRVIDGDTVEVRAMIWLDQHVTTRVRLRGIDAPEFSARCAQEALRADAATRALEQLLAGRRLYLAEITRDKYGGRVVARIVSAEGGDIGHQLLAAGHARPYATGRRTGWCG